MQPHEVTANERPFGQGTIPSELNRFSWGAFLLPFFWGVTYRSWPVLTAWLLTLMSPSLILTVFGAASDNVPFGLFAAGYMTSQVVVAIIELWIGANAYRLLWNRDALVIELASVKPRFTVERFLHKQRTWALFGWGLTAAGVVSLTVFVDMLTAQQRLEAFGPWEIHDLTNLGILVSIGFLVAKIGAGFWLDRMMRKEPPGSRQDVAIPADEEGRRY